MPGLASTRLVAWSGYQCKGIGSDINIQDYVLLNINKILELATIDGDCWISCMSLAENQTDISKEHKGCKLRPDEGLDAISSLAPANLSTNMLVGGTNTVYAWLTQWLAENPKIWGMMSLLCIFLLVFFTYWNFELLTLLVYLFYLLLGRQIHSDIPLKKTEASSCLSSFD